MTGASAQLSWPLSSPCFPLSSFSFPFSEVQRGKKIPFMSFFKLSSITTHNWVSKLYGYLTKLIEADLETFLSYTLIESYPQEKKKFHGEVVPLIVVCGLIYFK